VKASERTIDPVKTLLIYIPLSDANYMWLQERYLCLNCITIKRVYTNSSTRILEEILRWLCSPLVLCIYNRELPGTFGLLCWN
jgi:hypothetical protein